MFLKDTTGDGGAIAPWIMMGFVVFMVFMFLLLYTGRTSAIRAQIESRTTAVLNQYYSENVEYDPDSGEFTISVSESQLSALQNDIQEAAEQVCATPISSAVNRPVCEVISVRSSDFEKLAEAGASASCAMQRNYVTDYPPPSSMGAVFRVGHKIPDGASTHEFGTQWCSEYHGKYMIPHMKDHPITITVTFRMAKFSPFLPQNYGQVFIFVGVRTESK